MIGKLTPTIKGIDDKPQMPTATEFLDKINELVDAVNELHTEAENNARIRATHESNINTNKKKINNIETQTDVIFNRIDMLNFAILDLHTPDGENKAINNIKKQTKKTEPADPYAEQRKWLGKLCKFWNNGDKPEDYVYGIFYNIFDRYPECPEDCPFQCGNGEWYEYCEPVKPNDNVIYNGDKTIIF